MIVIDMKKPETCADCPIINGEYGICEILDKTVWGIPPKDCPIVGEIPDKHGELCDKDKLKEATKNTVIQNSRGEVYQIGKAIAMMIDEAPTVLEATE